MRARTMLPGLLASSSSRMKALGSSARAGRRASDALLRSALDQAFRREP